MLGNVLVEEIAFAFGFAQAVVGFCGNVVVAINPTAVEGYGKVVGFGVMDEAHDVGGLRFEGPGLGWSFWEPWDHWDSP